MATTRFNFSLPVDVKTWLEDESKKTGISQSNLVLIALKTYMDQQNMMKAVNQIDLLKSYSDDIRLSLRKDLVDKGIAPKSIEKWVTEHENK